MTISATIPTRHDYQGNGVATSFSYSLKTNNKTHLKLIHTDTAGLENALGDLVVDTDYTVNGVGDAGGGTVDFPKAGSVYSILATNEKLAIIYNLPIEQTTDIPNTGRIFNVSIEDQLDYMTILINQLKELLDRSIKLPEGSTLTDITFAEGTSASNRASKVNVWNALGTALELLSVTSGLNVDPIAVKGDIVQGDVNGDAAKLAIGGTGSILNVVSGLLQYLSIGSSGDILSVVSGLLAYDKPWGVCWKKGADIASTAALTTGDDGNYFDVTGIDAITSIVTRGAGSIIRLHFDGALVLTHHATDLILPNGANITTIAGDEATFVEYATGDWRMVAWSGHVLEHTHATAAQGGNLGNAELGAIQATDITITGLSASTPDANTLTKDLMIGARCAFNGTGTPAYIEEVNFSGAITDNGAGDYTLTIDRDFANANYAADIAVMGNAGYGSQANGTIKAATAPLVGSIRIVTGNATDGSLVDFAWVSVILVGEQ